MKFRTRKQIANRFIQSVLWIDDEIIASETPTGDKFRAFFQPACDEFAKQGFLCHLKGFQHTAGISDPYADNEDLKICKNLVRRSDIVIIDWHLGSGTPENAVELIKAIVDSKGSKFCVVLSKAPDLEGDFLGALPEINNLSGGFLTNADGSKFFLLRNKQDFESGDDSCKLLIDNILDAVSNSYQDHLHWIALEIMANVKEVIPTLLANLPKETDKALMADSMIDKLETTLGFAVSAIGEDLYDIVTEMQLTTVNTCLEQFESDADFTELKANIQSESVMKHADLAAMVKKRDSKLQGFCVSYTNLTKLFEQKSLDRAFSGRVYQGAVYKPSLESREIWICISQGCDCAFKREVMMIRAKKDPLCTTKAPGKTFVTFDQNNYVVLAEATACLPKAVVQDVNGFRSGIEGLIYCGGLRPSVAMRIADRFFSHLTRIGVNQPSIIRELRSQS